MQHEPHSLPRPAALDEVKGWFHNIDQVLFDWFLTRQDERGQQGDLLELGVYMGKSAIFMGQYLREGQAFTVCDLFDSPADDAANDKEMNKSYSTLTRTAFEANYRAFHDELPRVVQGPSHVITSLVDADTCRFVHVDASHLYEHVHGDIEAARTLLGEDGIVVLDDFRAEHCPGVAAATWGAVATTGLKPLCITATKFYGTWGDFEPVRGDLAKMLADRDDFWHGAEEVAGHSMIRIDGKKARKPAQPRSRHAAEKPDPTPEPEPAAVPAQPGTRSRNPLRALLGRR